MSRIDDFDLKTILPSSISQDDEVRKTADAISANLNTVTAATPEALIYSRIDTARDALVDLLGWQFHMDIYDDTLPIGQKRELVKTAIKYHRYKGTPYALKEAVKVVSPESRIKEWFEYNGQPYHFKVIAEDPIDSIDRMRQLMQTIRDAKNVRSWLDGMEYLTTGTMYVYATGRTYEVETLTEEIRMLKDGNVECPFGIAASSTVSKSIRAAEFDTHMSTTQFGYAAGGQYDVEVLNESGNE